MPNKSTVGTPKLIRSTGDGLPLFEKQMLQDQKKIETWFSNQFRLTPAPVYGSVDLRNAGFKIAPIDMNLFPAGFNNLNKAFLSTAIEAIKVAIAQSVPGTNRILLIPENHTRNLFYWENINLLITILEEAGFTVRLGALEVEDIRVTLDNGKELYAEKIARQEDQIILSDFAPEVILLNNDLSSGIPDILREVIQPILPPAELGWSQRLKSQHFHYYAEVTEEFSQLIKIDPWFITPLFYHCGEINFMQRDGEDCLTEYVGKLLQDIQQKYTEYHIQDKPFVIVKADAGTYGMAVMTVRDVEEIKTLNRKQRTSMSKSKGGQPVQRVIVQEGVYTFETWGENNAVAEPVVYMMGPHVIGGFYRVHQNRGNDENLNAPGMQFEPLAFATSCNEPKQQSNSDACCNKFYLYGVIARLSMLAAAREMLAKS